MHCERYQSLVYSTFMYLLLNYVHINYTLNSIVFYEFLMYNKSAKLNYLTVDENFNVNLTL